MSHESLLLRLVVIFVAGLAILGIRIPAAEAAPPSTSKPHIDYYVMAHPDDENEAMSIVTNSRSGSYTVFIYLTQGEASSACTKSNNWWESNLGEIEPVYGWSTSSKTPCINSRRHAALQVLGNLNSLPNVPDNFNTVSQLVNYPPANGAAIFAGSKMAVFFYNYGDGNVETSEVEQAIAFTRAQRGISIPNLPESVIIAGSFTNGAADGSPQYSGCNEYQHRDHYAVQSAIFDNVGASTQLIRFGVSCKSDLDTNTSNGGFTHTMNSSAWGALMNANGVGLFSKHHGWMTNNNWPLPYWQSDADGFGVNSFQFSAEQSFWRRG